MKKRIFLCLGPGQMCVILSLLETWIKTEDQSHYEDHLFIAAHDYRDTPTHGPYVEAIKSMAKLWSFKSVYDFCKLSIDHGSRWDKKNQDFLSAFRQELIKDSGLDSCDMIITTRNWRVDYGILFWCFPQAKFICIGDGLNGVLEFSTRKSLPQPEEIWHTFPIYAFRTEYHKYAYPEKHHLIPYKNVRKTIFTLQAKLNIPEKRYPNGSILYLSQNLAELGHLTLDEEVQFFISKVIEPSTLNKQPIIFKPHPRDSSQKLNVFSKISQNANIQMEVLDHTSHYGYFPAEVLLAKYQVKKIVTISSSGALMPYLANHAQVEMYPEYDKRINLITTYKFNYPSTLPHFYLEFVSGRKSWDGKSTLLALPNPEVGVFYKLHPVLKYFPDVGGFYKGLSGFDLAVIQSHFSSLPEQSVYCKDKAILNACMALENNDVEQFIKSFSLPEIDGFELNTQDKEDLSRQFYLIQRCQKIIESFGAAHWESSLHLHSHLLSEFSGLFTLIHQRMNQRLMKASTLVKQRAKTFSGSNTHLPSFVRTSNSAIISPDCEFHSGPVKQEIIIEDFVHISRNCRIELRNDRIVLRAGTIVLAGSTVTQSTEPYSIISGKDAKVTHLFDFEEHLWKPVHHSAEINRLLEKRLWFPPPSDQELEIIKNQGTNEFTIPARPAE